MEVSLFRAYLSQDNSCVGSSDERGKEGQRNANKGHCVMDWQSILIAIEMLDVDRELSKPKDKGVRYRGRGI